MNIVPLWTDKNEVYIIFFTLQSLPYKETANKFNWVRLKMLLWYTWVIPSRIPQGNNFKRGNH